MKIYLAHSLTYTPDEFKQIMLELRQKLQGKYEILEFFSLKGLGAVESQAVFKHDIACVKACDIVLAETSYPSTGLGFEIATALNLGKKVLAIAKQAATVSRMIMGIIHPNFKFMRYGSVEEIVEFNFEAL